MNQVYLPVGSLHATELEQQRLIQESPSNVARVTDMMQYCFHCQFENPKGFTKCIRCNFAIINHSDSMLTGTSLGSRIHIPRAH